MTFSIETLTNGAVLKGTDELIPAGSAWFNSAKRACTLSDVRTALAPGASCMAAAVAGWPFSRLEKP